MSSFRERAIRSPSLRYYSYILHTDAARETRVENALRFPGREKIFPKRPRRKVEQEINAAITHTRAHTHEHVQSKCASGSYPDAFTDETFFCIKEQLGYDYGVGYGEPSVVMLYFPVAGTILRAVSKLWYWLRYFSD